jgi:hypothetical protein
MYMGPILNNYGAMNVTWCSFSAWASSHAHVHMETCWLVALTNTEFNKVVHVCYNRLLLCYWRQLWTWIYIYKWGMSRYALSTVKCLDLMAPQFYVFLHLRYFFVASVKVPHA